jgi:hypothetical protein
MVEGWLTGENRRNQLRCYFTPARISHVVTREWIPTLRGGTKLQLFRLAAAKPPVTFMIGSETASDCSWIFTWSSNLLLWVARREFALFCVVRHLRVYSCMSGVTSAGRYRLVDGQGKANQQSVLVGASVCGRQPGVRRATSPDHERQSYTRFLVTFVTMKNLELTVDMCYVCVTSLKHCTLK